MIDFKAILAAALINIGLCSAAVAAPVTFTYRSNAIDLAIFEEDWQQAWLESAGHLSPARLQGLRAEMVLEVDCDISGTHWNCADIEGRGDTGSLFYTSIIDTIGGVTLASKSGFSDHGVYAWDFQVDATGQVSSWHFFGTETSGIGDFNLSSEGDAWNWETHGVSSGAFYCTYIYGFDPAHTDDICANGETAPNIRKSFLLGTGTWTVDRGDTLVTMPLPAGLLLMLSGTGAFAYLRRRQTKRQAFS
ncbi:VPLPA-CTERM sorting domain-containing protein [uncultured Roseobacter sp.]|uniref:VPLPA-CTERM sorting domain-containing protein n=1 Tax=uncultured Roseobacter sp. TaxID=114847 RepID=UPI002614A696|nr:VPLPA-CTERM sorting domain-containing protein [uncultured Roseobacter sp.]